MLQTQQLKPSSHDDGRLIDASATLTDKATSLKKAKVKSQNESSKFTNVQHFSNVDSKRGSMGQTPSVKASQNVAARRKPGDKQRNGLTGQGMMLHTTQSGHLYISKDFRAESVSKKKLESYNQLKSKMADKRESQVRSMMSTLGQKLKEEVSFEEYKDAASENLSQREDHYGQSQNHETVSSSRKGTEQQHLFLQKTNKPCSTASALFCGQEQEKILAQALRQHRLSQPQTLVHHSLKVAQNRLTFPKSDLQAGGDLTNHELPSPKNRGRQLHMQNELEKTSLQTGARLGQSTAQEWQPETLKRVNKIFSGQHSSESPNKTCTGFSQLQNSYQRRKPFQLKPKTSTHQSQPATLQGPRDLQVHRFNEFQPEVPVPAQQAVLSKAQPISVIPAAQNMCFLSGRAPYTSQIQPSPPVIGQGSSEESSIQVKGVKKGLQRQYGRNFARFEQLQPLHTCSDDINFVKKVGPPKEGVIDPRAQFSPKPPRKYQESHQFGHTDSNQKRKNSIFAYNFPQQNAAVAHQGTQLANQNMLIEQGANSSIFKQFTSALGQTPNVLFDSQEQLLQQRLLSVEKMSYTQALLQSSRLQREHEEDALMAQFIRQQLECQMQADRASHVSSEALQQYHQVLHQEIEKLRQVSQVNEPSISKRLQQTAQHSAPFALLQPPCNTPCRLPGAAFETFQFSAHRQIKECLTNQSPITSKQGCLCGGKALHQQRALPQTQQHSKEPSPQLNDGKGSQDFSLAVNQMVALSKRNKADGEPEMRPNEDTPATSRLDKLKELQLRLLNSHHLHSNSVSIANSSGSQMGHRRNKQIPAGDDQNLTPGSFQRTRPAEGLDLTHLKNFIKKQVIKFYQNNLVQENMSLRQQGIECKGQTIGSLSLAKPLGNALHEVRSKLQTGDKRLSSLGKPSTDVVPLLPAVSAEIPNFERRQLRTKTKSSVGLVRIQRPKASTSVDFNLSETRRNPVNILNLFFQQINEFVRVTLKFKETITQPHLAQIRRLGRQIGLKFGNVKELDAKFINSKDFVAILKSKIYCMLNSLVMRTDAPPSTDQTAAASKTYKFYVEPSGNNHTIVRSVIKRRSWFTTQDISLDLGWSGQGPKLLNLIWTQVRRPRILQHLQPYQIYNHVDGVNEIAQKSSLFVNMRSYYSARELRVFDYLPETYLVPSQVNFELHPQFKAYKQACKPGQLWIFKPGECTNRGHGIRVFNDYEKLKQHMMEFCRGQQSRRGQSRYRHCIIQKYIKQPLLINKRKFDIRVFALFVCHAETGLIRGYFYDEGYLRTSSKDFNVDKWDNRLIHLTNDAVQKHSTDYGKYESANKISYLDFDKHLLRERNVSFLSTIVPKIKQQVADVFDATGRSLYRPDRNSEGGSRCESASEYNAFEILGFDFMLDHKLRLKLIEVNTNPCLDTPCMLLQRIIPQMLDQTLKLAVDPFLQASEHQYYMTQDLTVSEMRFTQVYQDSMDLARRDQRMSNAQARVSPSPSLDQLTTQQKRTSSSQEVLTGSQERHDCDARSKFITASVTMPDLTRRDSEDPLSGH